MTVPVVCMHTYVYIHTHTYAYCDETCVCMIVYSCTQLMFIGGVMFMEEKEDSCSLYLFQSKDVKVE